MKNIKLAIRSILHFRVYSGINLLGLALSLACAITIFRYVYGEYTVDRFNKKLDRIFISTQETADNSVNIRFANIMDYNGNEMSFDDLTNHPGVERYSQLQRLNEEIIVNNQKYNATVLMTDSNFLKITDYPVVSGVDNLSELHNALITRGYAHKIFGNENPIGRTLQISSGEIITVTGLIGEVSTKATHSFDIVVSLSDWRRYGYGHTLALLYPNVDYQTINKQYEDFFYMNSAIAQVRFQLFPLSKVYFDKNIAHFALKQGNKNYVNILMAVGFLILLMGVINYINIYTVVMLRRGREFGIKKVFGAGRHNLFFQLLTENMLMTGLAIIAALLIVRVTNPFITGVLQLDQIPNIRFDIVLSFIILLSLPLIMNIYPFFRYNYSQTVASLQNVDTVQGSGSLRRIFLSFQYVITIVMIIVSLFFIKQLRFMLDTDPGYRTNDIIKVKFIRTPSYTVVINRESYMSKQANDRLINEEITQKMNACPLFTYWTRGQSPNDFSTKSETLFKLQGGEYKGIILVEASESWFRLFDIPLINGRLWNDETDDGRRDFYLVVTESVLKLFDIADFNSALLQPQKRLIFRGIDEINPPYRILGVVKDFDYLHLSQNSAPVAFYYFKGDNSFSSVSASIVPGQTKEAITFLRNLHNETVGGEFTYTFVEDEVYKMYTDDKKIASIYSIFTFIAIFISALGLLSMSLFDVQQRRKEIAIRKVNGASFYDIIRLLLKKYFWSLTVSFFIAVPIAMMTINRYLEDFAHKAPTSWWLFAAAIILTAGISLLTLIYQTQKAANQNPADVMKGG